MENNNTKKKKILYIITKSNFGGAQRYLFDLATNVPKERYDVVVALGGTGEHDARTGRLKSMLEESGVRTIVIKNFMRDISLMKECKSFFEILQIIRSEKPDVLHSMSSKAGGLGACAGRILGVKKIIFTSHGLAYDESWRPWWQRVLIFISTWWTFVFATKTIQITNDTYERARKLPFMKNKVALIHNGIHAPGFVTKDEARMRLCKHESICNEDWIGTIAELTSNKNLLTLIDAYEIMHNQNTKAHLWIVGAGEEDGRIKKHIKKKSLENFVHVTGYVPDASKYLLAFSIFTLPSIKEGLPYVLLEAGHASLPVVASNIPGISDIITSGENGIMVEPTKDTLAKALTELHNDREKMTLYGSALKSRVQEVFSLSSMVEKTTELY